MSRPSKSQVLKFSLNDQIIQQQQQQQQQQLLSTHTSELSSGKRAFTGAFLAAGTVGNCVLTCHGFAWRGVEPEVKKTTRPVFASVSCLSDFWHIISVFVCLDLTK